MDTEIWKDIAGYEGIYQVSNKGQVRSLDRVIKKLSGERIVKGRIIKPSANLKGYLFVYLYRDGCGKMRTIHRLVAEAFIPNHSLLPQINHRDEDKTNNDVDNLEWCDNLYNARYGTRNQRVSDKTSRAVIVLNKDGSEYGRYDSLSDVSKAIGRCKSAICGYIKLGSISPIGLIFKYL